MSGSGTQQASSTDDVRTSVSDDGCNNCESAEQPDVVLRYAEAVTLFRCDYNAQFVHK